MLAVARKMGRKKRWHEQMRLPLPDGTKARIAAVLEKKEGRTNFVREAIEREIKRREKQAERKRKP